MIDTINNKHYNPEDLHADLRNWLIGAVDDGCLDKRDLIVGFVKFLSSDEMVKFCWLNEIDIDWLAEWAD